MTSLGKTVAAALPPGSGAQLLPGTVLAIDWSTQTALVNCAGGNINAAMIGDAPLVDDAVQVLIVAGSAVILGVAARGTYGTVQADPAGGLVSVTCDDGITYPLPYGVGLSLAVGDKVLVTWSNGGMVVQEVTGSVSTGASSPTPPAPKPKPPSGNTGMVTKSRNFNPTTSASKRRGGGWSQGVVYFGQSYSSAGWFYGSSIADSIPDDAQLVSIKLYLEITASSGVSYLTLGMHDQKVVPPGDIILSDAVNFTGIGNGFRGWVDLSGGVFFDRLVKGLMFGISTKGPGYRRMPGAPQTGTIAITWKE